MKRRSLRIIHLLVLALSLATIPDQADSPQTDPYVEVMGQLWDQMPDWMKPMFVAQMRAAVEEHERETEEVGSENPS